MSTQTDLLKQHATTIKNEVADGANTANRVGGAILEAANILESQESKIAEQQGNILSNTEKISVLGNKNVYIKYFVASVGNLKNPEIGDVFYHTSVKKLYKIIHVPVTVVASHCVEIPLMEDSYYIYDGKVYRYDKASEDLVEITLSALSAFIKLTPGTNVDDIKEHGLYLQNGNGTVYGNSILLVTKLTNITYQTRYLLSSGGETIIETRSYNGSWSSWRKILTSKTEADVNAQTKDFTNDFNIVCNGGLDGSLRFISGRTRIIPIDGASKILFTSNVINNNFIQFLAFLPSLDSPSGSLVSCLASGEGSTRRMIAANTTVELDVPSDAKFIITNYYNSDNVTLNIAQSIKAEYNKSTSTSWIADLFTRLFSKVNDPHEASGDIVSFYKNTSTIHAINVEGITINDHIDELAGGQNEWLYDKKTGMAFVMYITGKDRTGGGIEYYEPEGTARLAVFPMSQPWRTEWFDVCKSGATDAEGATIGKVFQVNICEIESGKVRCFVSVKSGGSGTANQYYWYRDFDFATKSFSELKRVKHNGVDLTFTTLHSFITNAGYSSPSPSLINIPCRANTSISADGYRYAIMTDIEGKGYQVVVKTNDNYASVQLVGVIPYISTYESAIASLNGTYYILYRVQESEAPYGDNSGQYLTTTTDFVTYTNPQRVGTLCARPDIFVYEGSVYLVTGNVDKQLDTFLRNNIIIKKGSGSLSAGYSEFAVIRDDRGVVQPIAYIYGLNLLMVYNNSVIGMDMENFDKNRYRGKECLVFNKFRLN